jgi:hypothetical protein
MIKNTSSVASVLFFSYLFISVCFSAPASTALLGSFAPLVSSLPILNQLFLASLLNIDANVDISILSGFSSPVVDVIKGATSASIVADVAASVSLLNLINICVKLNALIKVNPTLANIITAKADAYVSALDGFFGAVGPVSAVAKAILDVRTAPNFVAALTAAGVANIPALINLGLLINICVMFNQVFQQILYGLVPALAAVVAGVLVTVNNVLIAVSALLGNVLATVVGLLGGILNTVAGLLNGLVFPTLFQITGIVFPTLNQLLSQSLLNQLVPLPGNTIPIPSAALAPAATLFNLLNCAQ